MKNMKYLGLTAAIFTGDLFLKNRMEKELEPGQKKEILKGRILLRKYHNEGACLNLGEKKTKAVAAVSLLLTGALSLVFLFTLTKRGCSALKTGLSLLLGGAWSNTYDRLKRKYVVDYFSINVKWKPLRQIIFNLSDFCILIGALIVAFTGDSLADNSDFT